MAKRRFGPYTVETSNEDKVLFPADGITKGEVIDYYLAVADVMLPHLADRPLTVQRFPDGIESEGFFQKSTADHFPDWIDRVRVDTEEGSMEQAVCSNAATLAYLGQLACLTFHSWTSRRGRLDRPDRLVIDLDPAEDDFEPVRTAARHGGDLLGELDLPAFLMTTGSRGLHLVVPLDRSESFDDVRSFARNIASELTHRHPDTLTTEQRKSERGARVYLDVGRNAYGQTAVAPYSLRAREGAPAAAPLEWQELEDPDLDARRWTLHSLQRRLAQREDPWARIARHGRSLSDARRRLERIGTRPRGDA